MLSSPSFLVVSRRELPADDSVRDPVRKSWISRNRTPAGRNGDHDYSEVDVHVRISYKTLVFAFITFDVITKVITAISHLL